MTNKTEKSTLAVTNTNGFKWSDDKTDIIVESYLNQAKHVLVIGDMLHQSKASSKADYETVANALLTSSRYVSRIKLNKQTKEFESVALSSTTLQNYHRIFEFFLITYLGKFSAGLKVTTFQDARDILENVLASNLTAVSNLLAWHYSPDSDKRKLASQKFDAYTIGKWIAKGNLHTLSNVLPKRTSGKVKQVIEMSPEENHALIEIKTALGLKEKSFEDVLPLLYSRYTSAKEASTKHLKTIDTLTKENTNLGLALEKSEASTKELQDAKDRVSFLESQLAEQRASYQKEISELEKRIANLNDEIDLLKNGKAKVSTARVRKSKASKSANA